MTTEPTTDDALSALDGLERALDEYGRLRQNYGQTWKPHGKGGELNQSYLDRLPAAREAVRRAAALIIAREIENAYLNVNEAERVDYWRRIAGEDAEREEPTA